MICDEEGGGVTGESGQESSTNSALLSPEGAKRPGGLV